MEEEANTNIYEDKEIYENIPIDQLMNYDNCIIIYNNANTDHVTEHNDVATTEQGNKTHLNRELGEIIKLYGFIPMTRLSNKRSLITRIHFTHEDKNIYLEVDPNDQHKMTWIYIKTLCDKMQIQFQNQCFGAFVGQLKEKFMNQKAQRHIFTKTERQTLFENSDKMCSCCGKVVTVKGFHVDHIVPVANGGTNDDENLQVVSLAILRRPKKKQRKDMLNHLKPHQVLAKPH